MKYQTKKLEEIASVLNGLWIGKKPPFVTIGVIRNTNFTKDCKLDSSNIAYIDVEERQFSTRKLLYGDIIIEKSGGSDKQPVGRPILFDIQGGDYSFSNFTSALRVKDDRILLPEFLYLCLYAFYRQGRTKQLQSKTTGLRNLDLKSYKRIDIPVPLLTEQQRIVEELDYLTSIIEKQKKQLEQLDTLALSIFYDLFGDPENTSYDIRPLMELAKCKLSYGSGASAISYDNETRYIRITDILDDGTLSVNKMSPNKIDEKYLLSSGDILFARSGATVGKTYLYSQADGRAIYAGYLIRFRPNEKLVLPQYVFYFTRTSYYKAFVEANAQAVAQPNINAQQYGQLKVCVPPIPLQREFSSRIEAIEKQKSLLKESIKETEELFNSRMDYYFN